MINIGGAYQIASSSLLILYCQTKANVCADYFFGSPDESNLSSGSVDNFELHFHVIYKQQLDLELMHFY